MPTFCHGNRGATVVNRHLLLCSFINQAIAEINTTHLSSVIVLQISSFLLCCSQSCSTGGNAKVLLRWCINAAPLYAAVKITSTNCAVASWLLSLLLRPWILCLASLIQHPLPFLPTLSLLVPLDLCIHQRAHLLYIASARTVCECVRMCALPQAARHATSQTACLDREKRDCRFCIDAH